MIICFNYFSKISKNLLSEDGKVVDWKKKFKLKKLESITQAQRIQDLKKANENLEKEIKVKDITIQRMADSGMSKVHSKDEKRPDAKTIKETYEKIVRFKIFDIYRVNSKMN